MHVVSPRIYISYRRPQNLMTCLSSFPHLVHIVVMCRVSSNLIVIPMFRNARCSFVSIHSRKNIQKALQKSLEVEPWIVPENKSNSPRPFSGFDSSTLFQPLPFSKFTRLLFRGVSFLTALLSGPCLDVSSSFCVEDGRILVIGPRNGCS
jgi:hypothetical protein